MIQPRCVPSNAPSLDEANGVVHQAARVFREHSANRQPADFQFGRGRDVKYPPTLSSENTYPAYYQHAPHSRRRLPQTALPQSARCPYKSSGLTPEGALLVKRKAERLWKRCTELPQYLKYREKQSKDDKANGEQKWPDHVEQAFFQALVRYPPAGRKKFLYKEKQRGRNELIADWIEEATGEPRTRKQVSSHIQVLKPFVVRDPDINVYLSAPSKKDGRNIGGHPAPSGRRSSTFPVGAPPSSVCLTYPVASHRADFEMLPQDKGKLELFEPVEFQMFVQRKFTSNSQREEVERLHTYTQSLSEPLGKDHHIPDLQTLTRDFPLLATLHARQSIDCNVLIAEASLALPGEMPRGQSGVELGISFLCRSRHLPATPDHPASPLRCFNHFYRDGKYENEYSGESEVRMSSVGNGGHTETPIKFGSVFWAKTLGEIAKRHRQASRETGKEPEVATMVKGLRVIQEFVVKTDQGHQQILVIHWSFRLSSSNQGRASWRKLLLPTQSSHYREQPHPERVDSLYEYHNQATESSQPTQYPSLRSPFAYDNASSALPSTNWSSTMDNSLAVSQKSVAGASDLALAPADQNPYDFHGSTMNIGYDPALTSFDAFDSSAFNAFDPEFTADSALQDYAATSQDYSQVTHSQDLPQPPYSQDESQPAYSRNYPQPTHSQSWYGNYGTAAGGTTFEMHSRHHQHNPSVTEGAPYTAPTAASYSHHHHRPHDHFSPHHHAHDYGSHHPSPLEGDLSTTLPPLSPHSQPPPHLHPALFPTYNPPPNAYNPSAVALAPPPAVVPNTHDHVVADDHTHADHYGPIVTDDPSRPGPYNPSGHGHSHGNAAGGAAQYEHLGLSYTAGPDDMDTGLPHDLHAGMPDAHTFGGVGQGGLLKEEALSQEEALAALAEVPVWEREETGLGGRR